MWWLKKQIRNVAHRGIEVQITEDYMSKQELVNWCSQNTMNVFLYDRDLPGLAATTDQCITSGRPLAVSDNETFRHVLEYVGPYPYWNLKKSLECGWPGTMKHYWTPSFFKKHFEQLLDEQLKAPKFAGGVMLSALPTWKQVYTKLTIAAYWRWRWVVGIFV